MAKKSGKTLTYILLSALILLCVGGIISQTNSLINNDTSPDKPSGDVIDSTTSEDTSGDLNDDSSIEVPSDDVTDTPSDIPVIAKTGWHIVDDLTELSAGDYVTFISSTNYSNNFLIGDFNTEVKRFNIINDSKLEINSDLVGSISNSNGEGNYFEIGINNGGYYFLDDGLYLTSAYSSGNTCKLTNILNDYSTFDISFENGVAVCKARGDKKCNTLKYSSSYFSLYPFESSYFPMMVKWYGEEEPMFDSRFDVTAQTSYLDLNEWNIVYEQDLVLADGMEIIPIHINPDGDSTTIGRFDSIKSKAIPIYTYSNYLYSDTNVISSFIIEQSDYDGYFKLKDSVADSYFECGDMSGHIKMNENKLTMYYLDSDELHVNSTFVFGMDDEDNFVFTYENIGILSSYDPVTYFLVKKNIEGVE